MVKASDKIQEGPKLQEQSGAFCILTVSEKSTGADKKMLRSSTFVWVRRTSPSFSRAKAEKFKAPERGGTWREGGPAGGQCRRRPDHEHGRGCLTHLGSGVTLLFIVKVSPSFSLCVLQC